MPNCFSLTKKGESEPAKLAGIDDEICKHFGVNPHPHDYYLWWYDVIGFKLALGKNFDEIDHDLKGIMEGLSEEQKPTQQRLIEINIYLKEHYESNAWYQVHK